MTVEADHAQMLAQALRRTPSNEILGVGRWLRAGGSVAVTTASGSVGRARWKSRRNNEPWGLRSRVDPGVVAVVGLKFEARLIAGPSVRAVVLGSERIPLVTMLLPTDRGVDRKS